MDRKRISGRGIRKGDFGKKAFGGGRGGMEVRRDSWCWCVGGGMGKERVPLR